MYYIIKNQKKEGDFMKNHTMRVSQIISLEKEKFLLNPIMRQKFDQDIYDNEFMTEMYRISESILNKMDSDNLLISYTAKDKNTFKLRFSTLMGYLGLINSYTDKFQTLLRYSILFDAINEYELSHNIFLEVVDRAELAKNMIPTLSGDKKKKSIKLEKHLLLIRRLLVVSCELVTSMEYLWSKKKNLISKFPDKTSSMDENNIVANTIVNMRK